jgi:hypothetical protein
MCHKQPTRRFDTTTVSSDGEFFADPSRRHLKPTISAATAYRHFHREYGATTPAQDRHTEVRYGRISYVGSGPASANAVGYVPYLRRTRAWLITNCVNPSSPTAYGDPRQAEATMIAVITDSRKPNFWVFSWTPAHQTNKNLGGREESGLNKPYPAPASTPLLSTKWHVVSRGNGRILLRYRTRKCFTFDHVNVEYGKQADVGVILSSGPRDVCPRPSATAPYVSIKRAPGARPFGRLHHLRTGRMPYEPESA